MKLQNCLAVITCFTTGFLVCWKPANPQQEYPNTGASEFVTTDEWAVSSPKELDQTKDANSDMSPDHWGGSANLENPDSYRTVQTELPWDGKLENHPWIYADGLSEELIAEFKNGSLGNNSELAETGVESQSVDEDEIESIEDSNPSPTRAVGSNKENDIPVPLPPSSKNRSVNQPEGEAVPLPPTNGSKALTGFGNLGNKTPTTAPATSKPTSQTMPAVPVPRAQNQPRNNFYNLENHKFDSFPQGFRPPEQRQEMNPAWAGDARANNFPAPNYRPDLGFHSQNPTIRFTPDGQDYGQQFGYEKKEYPSLRELLATRKNFGSAEMLIIKPYFQGNTAIAVSNGLIASFDFDHELAPQLELGFETKNGPGVYFSYFQFDQDSNPTTFTSNGVITGTTSVWMAGHSQWSRISADNAGETLTAQDSLETHLFNVALFKDIKFPVSHVTGSFGFTYASISQELNAVLTNGGGAEIGRLTHTSDLEAYGPSANLEYVRPIGHTKLEFVSSLGSAFLFGNRDQMVLNNTTGDFGVIGADEFVSIFDLNTGFQWRRYIGETRSVFWKVSWVTQTWFNGGSAISTDSDFGYRGIGFTFGLNR